MQLRLQLWLGLQTALYYVMANTFATLCTRKRKVAASPSCLVHNGLKDAFIAQRSFFRL